MNGRNSSAQAAATSLRIGILCEYGSLNGGEYSLLALLEELARSRADVTAVVACPDPSPLAAALQQRGITTLSSTLCHSVAHPRYLDADRLNQLAGDCELDLWHANSLAMGRRLGTVARQLTVPTTAHLRDIIKLSASALTALAEHRGLVAVSAATRQFHLAQGLPEDRLITIYNGIDIDHWQPREPSGWLHRELDLPGGCPLIAAVGQICLRKGQDDWARAAVQIGKQHPEARFLLIGQRYSLKPESVAFEESIRRTFEEAGLSSRFFSLGFRSDLNRILPELSLLLHAARQEPFGRVLLEAAACGVPMVATETGGTAEMLQNAESARLVPAHDSAALAEAALALLSDSDLCRQLAAAARRRVTEQFTIAEHAQRMCAFWSRVAAQGTAASVAG